jgi:hypothetical protein
MEGWKKERMREVLGFRFWGIVSVAVVDNFDAVT